MCFCSDCRARIESKARIIKRIYFDSGLWNKLGTVCIKKKRKKRHTVETRFAHDPVNPWLNKSTTSLESNVHPSISDIVFEHLEFLSESAVRTRPLRKCVFLHLVNLLDTNAISIEVLANEFLLAPRMFELFVAEFFETSISSINLNDLQQPHIIPASDPARMLKLVRLFACMTRGPKRSSSQLLQEIDTSRTSPTTSPPCDASRIGIPTHTDGSPAFRPLPQPSKRQKCVGEGKDFRVAVVTIIATNVYETRPPTDPWRHPTVYRDLKDSKYLFGTESSISKLGERGPPVGKLNLEDEFIIKRVALRESEEETGLELDEDRMMVIPFSVSIPNRGHYHHVYFAGYVMNDEELRKFKEEPPHGDPEKSPLTDLKFESLQSYLSSEVHDRVAISYFLQPAIKYWFQL